MAINTITIVQDNIVNGSNLVPIHSPVLFLAEIDYTGATPPDFISVDILDIDLNVLDTLKSFKISDQSSTLSTFSFEANDYIKSIMPAYDDFLQTDDTFVYCENMTKQLYVRFYDPDTPATKDEVLIDFAHGAAQFGENPNFNELFYNFGSEYYSKKDENVYSYFYNTSTLTIIFIDKIINQSATRIITSQALTEIGFYRLKLNADEDYLIEYSTDGGEFYSQITTIDECEGLQIKYLDHKGQFRFYPLNNFYKKQASPKQIGDVEKLYTSILDAQSNRSNIGYNNSVSLLGTIEVPSTHLEKLKDLYDSPLVYLKIGSTDVKKDWLEVICKASDNVIRRRKNNFGFIDFNILYPEQFSIKLI